MNTPSVAYRSVLFNSHRETDSRLISKLINKIADRALRKPHRKTNRVRNYRSDYKSSIRRSVHSLLLDTYTTYKAYPLQPISIQLRSPTITKHRRNGCLHPEITHGGFTAAYQWLLENGAIEVVREGYRPSDGSPGQTTQIRATERLVRLVDRLGLSIDQIRSERPLIVLKGPKRRRAGVEVAERLTFRDTAETLRMKADLALINEVHQGHQLKLGISAEQLRALATKMAVEPDRCPLDLTAKSLSRIFNNGSFTDGGRFYGGWWQGVPKEWRRYILIDGETTVELDYRAFHPWLLYTLAGQRLEGEAYDVGVDGQFRPLVKEAFNRLLNGNSRRPSQPEGFDPDAVGCTWPELVRRLLEKHRPIADHMGQGWGIRLQRIDSDIAEAVMLHFARQGIPCLGIHDSFIVQQRHKAELREAMEGAHRTVLRERIGDRLVVPPEVRRS